MRIINGFILTSICCFSQIVSSGLLSEWRFDDGSGTTLTDYVGSCDGTLTNSGGSGAPAWVTGGVAFTSANRHAINLPSGCFSSAVTVQILAYINPTAAGTGIFPLLGYQTGPGGFQVALKDAVYASYNFTNPGTANGSGYRSAVYLNGFGPSLITTVIASGDDLVYVNGTLATVYYVGGDSVGTTKTDAMQFGASTGTGSGGFWSGTMYYAAIYDRALTAGEVASNYAYMRSVVEGRGVTFNPTSALTTNSLICSGDSLTGGYDGLTAPCASITPTVSMDKTTLSRPGGTATGFVESGPGWVDPFRHPLSTHNIAVLWAGTNDMAYAGGSGVKTPAQAYAQYAAFCQARRDAGWKVVAVPMISRTGSTGGVNAVCDAGGMVFGGGSSACTNDTLKTQLNLLIAAGWNTFADDYADLSLNTALTDTGAYANPTAGCDGMDCFQGDGVHLTDAGYASAGGYMQDAVNRIIARASLRGSAGQMRLDGGAKVQ